MDPTPQKIYSAIGLLDGKITGIEERIKRLEGNTEFIRLSMTQDGKQIAEISERCRIRGKQISQLMNRVGGCEEATGRFKFKDANEREQKRSIHWGITTAISILAVFITVVIFILS